MTSSAFSSPDAGARSALEAWDKSAAKKTKILRQKNTGEDRCVSSAALQLAVPRSCLDASMGEYSVSFDEDVDGSEDSGF